MRILKGYPHYTKCPTCTPNVKKNVPDHLSTVCFTLQKQSKYVEECYTQDCQATFLSTVNLHVLVLPHLFFMTDAAIIEN